MEFSRVTKFMDRIWDDEIIPALTDYIRIPNKSPAFDPDWGKHGYMEQVVAMFAAWANSKLDSFSGSSLEVVRLPGRTPLILIEIPGTAGASATAGATKKESTVLMYGHLDKQPEMAGWAEDTGPWQPVLSRTPMRRRARPRPRKLPRRLPD